MNLPIGPQTEATDERYRGLDTWGDREVLRALLDSQRNAVASLEAALDPLARAAALAAGCLETGGRLVYLASGSPALMALADALELPQTYGIASDRILLILADAPSLPFRLDGAREDRGEDARAEVRQHAIDDNDCVIAISASGTTPFTLEGMREAGARGAATVGIAGNREAPLLLEARVPILLDSGPEVISGSTRMAAGTAQKVALNMFSTLLGVRLGHVHDGLMVNLLADNHKLRGRASRIIVQVTGAGMDSAQAALAQAGGAVKPAILIAAGAESLAQANQILERSRGNVRQALAMLAAGLEAVN